jgi:hypothetical protein
MRSLSEKSASYKPGRSNWKLTPEQRDELAAYYEAGHTLRECCARFDLKSDKSAAYIIRRRGVRIRTNSETKRRYAVNEAALDELTADSAYVLGFLSTDESARGSERREADAKGRYAKPNRTMR